MTVQVCAVCGRKVSESGCGEHPNAYVNTVDEYVETTTADDTIEVMRLLVEAKAVLLKAEYLAEPGLKDALKDLIDEADMVMVNYVRSWHAR